MKALVATALAMLAGAVSAQDVGAMCRSFCDADASHCRKDAQEAAAAATTPAFGIFTAQSPSASYDFTPERHEQVLLGAERDRRARSRQCGETRLACRQKCVAPSPASASAAMR